MPRSLASFRPRTPRSWRSNTWERKATRLLDTPEASPHPQNDVSQVISADDAMLASLGYKRELGGNILGWAVHSLASKHAPWTNATQCMNFVSGMPVLFGWVMMTGGPQAAITSWTVVSTISIPLVLSMAEIAAALPTAGGIYYWAYRMGGPEWGPFLSWMTAWWNWSAWMLSVPGTQQGATNFLISAIQINYPDAAFVSQPWFTLVIILVGLMIAMIPNVTKQGLLRVYFRFAIAIFLLLFFMFWTWFPIAVAGRFQPASFVFKTFHNGINHGPTQQASNTYCWVISFLFGAWEFGGYDASAHLAEETQNASKTVARGMVLSTISTALLSVPTLILILFCIQDFDALISASYANNWAEFLVQVVGPRGATAILLLSWIDCTCATAAVILSAQRVTFAISRDNILPASSLLRKVNGANAIPVNAAIFVFSVACLVSCTVLGSTVAFSAITATTVICQSMSYLFVLLTRYTFGTTTFKPASWNLGSLSRPLGYLSILWLTYLSSILLLPQVFPVTLQTLNYSPVCLVAVTAISGIGWIFPFGLGGRHWFKGPCNTVDA